jgi:hypothetical protein
MAAAATPGATSNLAPCEKPDAVGVARVVEIDSTGGPLFGLQHLKGHDFLRDREVVLTFDDGPHPVSTGAVLKALEDECVKATFFEIGQWRGGAIARWRRFWMSRAGGATRRWKLFHWVTAG